MWGMDDHYTTDLTVCPHCREAPRLCESDSCFVSCEPDEEGQAHTVVVLGEDRIIFASDYPHGDCDFPHSGGGEDFSSAPTFRMKSKTKYSAKTRRGFTGFP